MSRKRAQTAIKTKKHLFDRLSKNALQNVMSYFDYKGQDFMKMRTINRKSKNSYMQELQKRFNAERQFESLEPSFLEQSQSGLQAFMDSVFLFKHFIPEQKPMQPPVKMIALQDANLKLLNDLLKTSGEFQSCIKNKNIKFQSSADDEA